MALATSAGAGRRGRAGTRGGLGSGEVARPFEPLARLIDEAGGTQGLFEYELACLLEQAGELLQSVLGTVVERNGWTPVARRAGMHLTQMVFHVDDALAAQTADPRIAGRR